MTPVRLGILSLTLTFWLTGCGQGSAYPAGEWFTLIDREWELAPYSETYRCVRVTVEEDLYIQGFRDISPVGTHHTVLTAGRTRHPDGDFDCNPVTNAHEMLFASGIGGDVLELPEGVALKVEAGNQLLLNLHLYNVSGEPISGRTGIEVFRIAPEDVVHEAEFVFAGTVNISIPPQQEYEAAGACTFGSDATVLVVWPHMHQLGRHMRVVHEDEVLFDGPYEFDEQVFHFIEPRTVSAGERVEVYCTWQNDTDERVFFGDSSDQEMCFAGLYRYPAQRTGVFCTGDL
jgi:hypothetical protein